MKLVLTCEHAGNNIPAEYRELFKEAQEVLQTHRGYDPGAHDVYRRLKKMASFARSYKESRLLIEPNRSQHHPDLFSEFTRELPRESKDQLIGKYYLPYRRDVEKAILNYLGKGEEVVHLSIHTFTPQLNGKIRNTDIGLLYDPTRKIEREWCTGLKKQIKEKDNSLRVRMNYPYRGQSDGFTTHLRKRFQENYRGIEIEINQKFVKGNKMPDSLNSTLFFSIAEMLGY